MPPQLSPFFDSVEGDDARLNLTPCTIVEADMCIAGAQWMGGGNMVFYQSSSSTVLPHLSFSFRGADGDDGRLKLTPGAAPQGEAKDNGSMF
jgi:hypothetical protein